MEDFQLHEEDPVGGPTIDEVINDVAEDLGLGKETVLETKFRLRQNFIRSVKVSNR